MSDVLQEAKSYALHQLQKKSELMTAATPVPRAEAIMAALERAYLQGYAEGLDAGRQALEQCRQAVMRVDPKG